MSTLESTQYKQYSKTFFDEKNDRIYQQLKTFWRPQQSITFMYSALLCIYTFLTSFCISRFEITVNLHF